MVGSRNGRHGHSESDGRDLGTVQEVGTQETDGNKRVVEVNEGSSDNHGRLVLGAERSANSQRNHTSRHTDTADNEHDTTTESIDGEKSNERSKELPGQGTAGQSLGSLGVETKVLLEKNVGVHADQVGTGHLLVELEKDAQDEAVEELIVAHLEHVAETSCLVGGLFEGVLDTGDFSEDFGGVDGETAEGCDGVARFFGAVLEDEPAGRLGEAVDGGHEDEGEEDGDGNRGSPCDGTVLEFEETEVDP